MQEVGGVLFTSWTAEHLDIRGRNIPDNEIVGLQINLRANNKLNSDFGMCDHFDKKFGAIPRSASDVMGVVGKLLESCLWPYSPHSRCMLAHYAPTPNHIPYIILKLFVGLLLCCVVRRQLIIRNILKYVHCPGVAPLSWQWTLARSIHSCLEACEVYEQRNGCCSWSTHMSCASGHDWVDHKSWSLPGGRSKAIDIANAT